MISCVEKKENIDIYTKTDIMNIFKCESDKALRLLKFMYQANEANKIGKEYYIEKNNLMRFLDDYRGRELPI